MRRLLSLMFMMLIAGGCLPASRPIPAKIEIRQASTHEPVAAARLWLQGGRPFMPPRQVLGPPVSPWPNPTATKCVTDADGVGLVELAGNRPNWLTVGVDGGLSGYLLLRATEDDIFGARVWTPLPDLPMEVRVETVVAPTAISGP